ncbi:MAG: hypothetical protein IJ274_03055 [Lachnospiraceae bacterium]|nr:hypothetical protein [Lachnospiraceae bacterium]
MAADFSTWLAENGLVETFTTNAGDTLYTNMEKKFGVLKKNGESGVQSFYLDDVIEIKTFDDEHLVLEWNSCMTSWRVMERSTRFSTNEVYMDIRLQNQLVLRIQIFKGTKNNIKRQSNEHVNLLNYACQLSQIVYNCVRK